MKTTTDTVELTNEIFIFLQKKACPISTKLNSAARPPCTLTRQRAALLQVIAAQLQ